MSMVAVGGATVADRIQLTVFLVLASIVALKYGQRSAAVQPGRTGSLTHVVRSDPSHTSLRRQHQDTDNALELNNTRLEPLTSVAVDPTTDRRGAAGVKVVPQTITATADPVQIGMGMAGMGEAVQFLASSCGVLGPHQDIETMPDATDVNTCAASCARRAYRHFGFLLGKECWCADDIRHIETIKAAGGKTNEQAACQLDRPRHTTVFQVNGALPEIITMYIAPAKRTSSLFTSGRLEPFFSGRYAYRYRKLNAQVFRSDAGFKKEVCESTPGKKIFVQIAGAVPYLLTHWPDNSVLIMTADEIGNWGLGNGDRRFGPHGPGRDFKTNESSEYKHILLPDRIFPIFKQYHHYRQLAAFGDNVRFVPLGSRNEFPDVPPSMVKVAPQRRYVYSYMASLTDSTRKKVHQLLVDDKTIPEDKRFMQVSQSWHGTANNEEYVSPDRYRDIMVDSMFAICPRGHSVEQFRIYEAIEAGAIPVMDLKDGYLAQHLPAPYLDSPILLLNGWDTVVDEMTRLWQDPKALLERQQKLLRWYDEFMRNKMLEIEGVLESRQQETPAFCTKTSPPPPPPPS